MIVIGGILAVVLAPNPKNT
jgi:hypothetical protein